MKMAMKDGKIMLIEVDNTQMAIIKSWNSMKYDRRKNMMIGDCSKELLDKLSKIVRLDCQHFFRQIFLGYFSDIVQAFDTLRKNVCGDDYTSLHNPIVLSSVLPAYGMFHSIQILFL